MTDYYYDDDTYKLSDDELNQILDILSDPTERGLSDFERSGEGLARATDAVRIYQSHRSYIHIINRLKEFIRERCTQSLNSLDASMFDDEDYWEEGISKEYAKKIVPTKEQQEQWEEYKENILGIEKDQPNDDDTD